MADYFTNLSLILRLPSLEAQTYALELAGHADQARQGDELPANFPSELRDVIDDWTFDTEPARTAAEPALWLHSNCGGIDSLCAFLQHLLQKFAPTGRVEFEWSHDCSKPRPDAYGGGAAIVTAKKIQTMSTCEWLRQHAA